MKVIIAGSRYPSNKAVLNVLDSLITNEVEKLILYTSNTGVPGISAHWAEENNKKVSYYSLNHDQGRAASAVRNRNMLSKESPDLVIAFPGGSGVRDLVKASSSKGVPVKSIKFVGESFEVINY